MLNFILALCVIFATLALISIAFELKNTRSAIEDLGAELGELNSGLDELNSNVRVANATKRFNEPRD